MDVLIILVFTSLVLVTAALVLFIMRIRGGDFEHGDRLSLLPLDDELQGHEDVAPAAGAAAPRGERDRDREPQT